MKLKKRMFGLLLTLCFSIGILPGTAFAAGASSLGTGYGIEVHDIEITDANKDDVLGEADGDARSVTFDPDTATLTLDNADFAVEVESGKGAIVWSSSSPIDNLKICAKGRNYFTRVLASSSAQRTLTFTGSGALILTGAFAEIFTNFPENLDLVFDGVTFDITAGTWCNSIVGNNITITNGADVTATPTNTDAIRAFSRISITGNSIVNVTSTGSSAIAASNVDSDGSEAIEIQNSYVEADASEGYNGIFSNGSLTIQQAEVVADGNYPALFSGSDMTITDSIITATSITDYAIWSNANLSLIGDTNVKAYGGVNAANSFTITPKEDGPWDVFVGSSEEDAILMEGSPFEGNNIDMSKAADYNYFQTKLHKHTGGLATCTEKAVCDGCNREYGEIDAANHAGGNEIRDKRPASCTVAGYTGNTYCLKCGNMISAGEEIPAINHNYSKTWTSDKTHHWHECTNADCPVTDNSLKDGYAPHTYDRAIASDGYKASEAAGSKHEACSVCGYRKAAVKIPATGTPPSDTPATGDNNNLYLWFVLLVLAGSGLFGTIIYSRRKNI